MKRTFIMIAIAMFTACAAPPPDTTASPGRDEAVPPLALSQRCTNARYGISVSYPEGWHTNDGSVIPACSVFHAAPIDIPRNSELPFELAVVLGVENVPVDQLTRSSQFERVLSASRMTLGGRAAARVEVEATGEGLAERGMRSLRYVVDLGGGRTLIASTHQTDASYEQNQKVLERMVESVTVD